MRKPTKVLVFFSFIFAIFGVSSTTAQAASLYFSPSSGSHAVDTALPVSVYVSSADQAMNAASGVISFPPDNLEITSLSKIGSIFGLWVQEPSFSNSAGTVNFEGIVLNPGFTGLAGKVITINFKVKAAGLAPLNFYSGSALANDGKGTNILTVLGNAVFSLGGAVSTKVSAATAREPGSPVISSPTHPDPNKWYAKKDAQFAWTIPVGVTAIRILYDKHPTSLPSVLYSPPISEKQLKDLKDGTYYFHARFRNSAGWGATAHFRFQIDTQPPEPFSIKFIDGTETANSRPTVVFDTTDVLSGIDYYKIKIQGGDFFAVASDKVKSNPYTLPFQSPGKRNILVQAFDKAGNYAVATEEFTIAPLPAPALAEYSRTPWINPWYAAVSLGTLALILMLLWRGRRDGSLLRKRLRKEVREAESASHKAFDLLQEETREQIKTLEKTRNRRDLTAKEEKIIQRLKKNIAAAEKFVKKEIDDIAREVK